MLETLRKALQETPDLCAELFARYRALERPFLLRSELWDELVALRQTAGAVSGSALERAIGRAQEAAVDDGRLLFALRERIGRWEHVRVDVEAGHADDISVAEYLTCKERLARPECAQDWIVELDTEPFFREFFVLQESRSIGRGMEFLNRRLSSDLFDRLGAGRARLIDFLRLHKYGGQQLMLNGRIRDWKELQSAIRSAEELLAEKDAATPWADLEPELAELGLQPGWGRDAGRTLDTLRLLADLLEAPEPAGLERFLSRIPMIFNLLIVSPHGYFAQENVLGRPDTGGQVVYILDQVRALDREMRRRLTDQGLDIEPQIVVVTRLIPEAEGTSCDQRIEKIHGAENAVILRVPFRDQSGAVVPHWISRFEIWPYIERFARDAETEVLAQLGARPDLIVGNYSDGNLAATLMSHSLDVTQCNIAHALEKSKYLYSDLYWHENEERYHFSCQFTADLIAMNAADFIITSTYQEIAGTEHSIGQYESYASFPMPGLYRVVHGINVFDPKFNIVSPGADNDVYFPFSDGERRPEELKSAAEKLIFGGSSANARGELSDPSKPLLFTLARLDRIKNIAGLTEWFGAQERLRERANLLIVAGVVDPEQASDQEEREQVEKVHELITRHGMESNVRWLGLQLDKKLAGELYRTVADTRGAFVQPALFEAFGLTVIEAMTSGLPTFATRWGGPLEIIEHGVSGFHIDPNHGDRAGGALADFLDRTAHEPEYWNMISKGGLARVRARYTWERYAERMMTLSRIYGFWKHVTNLERAETRRYLEMFYGLQYRPLAKAMEGS